MVELVVWLKASLIPYVSSLYFWATLPPTIVLALVVAWTMDEERAE